MSEPKTKSINGEIKYKRNIFWKEISGTKYSAYRLETKFITNMNLPNSISEDIALTKELETINLNDPEFSKKPFSPSDREDRWPMNLCFLTKDFLKLLQKNGWDYDKEIWKRDSKLSEKPYTNFSKLDTLIFLDNSSHMAFDHNQKVLPVAIHYNYIDGGIKDGNYDLNKLFQHLKKRKDVKMLSDEIEEVPYYNRDGDCKKHFSFVANLSQDDYEKMWKCCQKDKQFPSCRRHSSIEDLDLLDMNQFKKNKKQKACY